MPLMPKCASEAGPSEAVTPYPYSAVPYQSEQNAHLCQSSAAAPYGMFTGATFNNCTIKVVTGQKRKIQMIESDIDSE